MYRTILPFLFILVFMGCEGAKQQAQQQPAVVQIAETRVQQDADLQEPDLEWLEFLFQQSIADVEASAGRRFQHEPQLYLAAIVGNHLQVRRYNSDRIEDILHPAQAKVFMNESFGAVAMRESNKIVLLRNRLNLRNRANPQMVHDTMVHELTHAMCGEMGLLGRSSRPEWISENIYMGLMRFVSAVTEVMAYQNAYDICKKHYSESAIPPDFSSVNFMFKGPDALIPYEVILGEYKKHGMQYMCQNCSTLERMLDYAAMLLERQKDTWPVAK